MAALGFMTDYCVPFGAAWGNVIATVLFACGAFAVFMLVLAIPALRGRAIKRKCACAASRDALRILEERERAKRNAMIYSVETVDAQRLPTVSPQLAEFARRERK